MEVENWQHCAICMDNFQKERADLEGLSRQIVRDVYDINNSQEFREDYEIYGAEDGFLRVRYHGECQNCGFETTLQLDQQFYPFPSEEEALQDAFDHTVIDDRCQKLIDDVNYCRRTEGWPD